jgi:hypothetical protein
MDEAVKSIMVACDPEKPATADYFVDSDEARGETDLARYFMRLLEGMSGAEDKYLKFLFSGHLGCGKSSELAHVSHKLKQREPMRPGYLPVLLNISDYFDVYDVTMIDLVLAVVTEVAATLKQEANYELKDSYFKTRFEEIKGYLLSDVEINEGEVEFAGLKLKVQRLKSSPDARKQVRDQLKEKEPRMLDEVNRVFAEARTAVRQVQDSQGRQAYADLVLIFDNLEKMQSFEGVKEPDAAHRELFLERYTQLTGLQVHSIFTVPLRLVRSVNGPQLKHLYSGEDPFVLPMIKVFTRGARDPYEKGIEVIKKMLRRRFNSLTLEEVFVPEALEFLLQYSGGHTRTVFSFVRTACTFAEKLPLSLKAVQEAVKGTVAAYSTSIPKSHWEKLARLDLAPDQLIDNADPDYLQMLENLSVLEYRNGGEGDVFEHSEPWYAVHPIVRELRKFKDARQHLLN